MSRFLRKRIYDNKDQTFEEWIESLKVKSNHESQADSNQLNNQSKVIDKKDKLALEIQKIREEHLKEFQNKVLNDNVNKSENKDEYIPELNQVIEKKQNQSKQFQQQQPQKLIHNPWIDEINRMEKHRVEIFHQQRQEKILEKRFLKFQNLIDRKCGPDHQVTKFPNFTPKNELPWTFSYAEAEKKVFKAKPQWIWDEKVIGKICSQKQIQKYLDQVRQMNFYCMSSEDGGKLYINEEIYLQILMNSKYDIGKAIQTLKNDYQFDNEQNEIIQIISQ
ncbi:UNKNOWN [Stylonychia lemnae]|uniref:Uncharacterized protein n=1 Tax=Stylonychia lemnae TaxID=5949 RepID=A0A078B0G0_STYLE|nr:UNKNOWN [Stylonychia lemnae]|eukprot:CDW87796.1 UNKNOWN [Stylonychia lemnae]